MRKASRGAIPWAERQSGLTDKKRLIRALLLSRSRTAVRVETHRARPVEHSDHVAGLETPSTTKRVTCTTADHPPRQRAPKVLARRRVDLCSCPTVTSWFAPASVGARGGRGNLAAAAGIAATIVVALVLTGGKDDPAHVGAEHHNGDILLV